MAIGEGPVVDHQVIGNGEVLLLQQPEVGVELCTVGREEVNEVAQVAGRSEERAQTESGGGIGRAVVGSP